VGRYFSFATSRRADVGARSRRPGEMNWRRSSRRRCGAG
jgi:hypothetical protein